MVERSNESRVRTGGDAEMTLSKEGFRSITGMTGPLVFVSGISDAGYGELVTIESPEGRRLGQVLQIDKDITTVQVFDGTMGLDTGNCTVWLERDVVRMPLGNGLIGRVMNGRGESLDGEALSFVEDILPVTGMHQSLHAGKSECIYRNGNFYDRHDEYARARAKTPGLLGGRFTCEPHGGADRPAGYHSRP